MEESKGSSLLSLFMSTPAVDHIPRGTTGEVVIHKEGPVMTVQRDETLPRVLRKLATEGFLAAPVLDGRQYVGFISMLDLVRHTTNLFWGDTVEQWVNFWDKEERFQTTTVDDVMRLPDTWDRDPFPPLRPDFTTFYALEMMARTRLHRMAVVDQKTHYSRKMVPLKGLYVAPSDSVLDVIRLMNDGNIHRVFVCSEESINNKKPVPTHVISQSDVLRQVLDLIVQDASEG